MKEYLYVNKSFNYDSTECMECCKNILVNKNDEFCKEQCITVYCINN